MKINFTEFFLFDEIRRLSEIGKNNKHCFPYIKFEILLFKKALN